MPEVGDAVADELDHVARAHEQDVEVVVLDARRRGCGRAPRRRGRRRGAATASARPGAPCWARPAGGAPSSPGARPRSGHRRRAGVAGALEHQPVAALAVVEPRGDPGDRRRARPGLARDLGVVHPRRRAAGRRPSAGPRSRSSPSVHRSRRNRPASSASSSRSSASISASVSGVRQSSATAYDASTPVRRAVTRAGSAMLL